MALGFAHYEILVLGIECNQAAMAIDGMARVFVFKEERFSIEGLGEKSLWSGSGVRSAEECIAGISAYLVCAQI